jgi:CO/xanthine dehydrogenase FAD-binding subunit
MLSSSASVYTPTTIDEALEIRAAHPDAVPLAGGTDLMVFLELGTINPASFIDLWGLRELDTIDVGPDGGLRIGALVTHTGLVNDDQVRLAAPSLVEAARTVGAKQIQNRGTLVGNIANGSPAGDTLPVLLALDAVVEMKSAARGVRRVPMSELYTGYRQLDLAADELITAVYLPPAHPDDHTHYRKVGTRLAQAISKVVMGARIRIEGRRVTEARIAYGSVAATPIRVPAVEQALVGQPVDPAVAQLVTGAITPLDDIRSTADYRLSVARRILEAYLESLR